jgi:hypothetical protein
MPTPSFVSIETSRLPCLEKMDERANRDGGTVERSPGELGQSSHSHGLWPSQANPTAFAGNFVSYRASQAALQPRSKCLSIL